MPIWSTTPPANGHNHGYRLIRSPAARPLHVLIISPELIGTFTHYVKGRTTPCAGDDCPTCGEGLPYRWHGYIACVVAGHAEKVVLELTAMAAEQLLPHRKEFGTLRGCAAMIERPSRRPNGRIRITCQPGKKADAALPQPPDLKAVLLHIWGRDDAPLEDNGHRKGHPFVTPADPEPDSPPISPSANP